MAAPRIAIPATDTHAVLEANRRFYEALNSLDMRAMDRVWLHEGWARCVHPGWPQLEGWDDIRESWESIFENTRLLRVAVGLVFVRRIGDTAWVSCIERVASTGEAGSDTAIVQANNWFALHDGEWRMILHHASHLPEVLQPTNGYSIN